MGVKAKLLADFKNTVVERGDLDDRGNKMLLPEGLLPTGVDGLARSFGFGSIRERQANLSLFQASSIFSQPLHQFTFVTSSCTSPNVASICRTFSSTRSAPQLT